MLAAEGINPRCLLVSVNPCWLIWFGTGVEYIPGAGVEVVGPKDTLRLAEGALSPLGTWGVQPGVALVPLVVTVVVLAAVVTGASSFDEPKLAIGPA